jgi:very-short-patch-repair endonuclease
MKKPVVTRRDFFKTDRQERIHIPQPPTRPLRLHRKTVLRMPYIQNDAWWFTLHRRGVRRPSVGEDPLEARAVSANSVTGYLHERIVYRWLTARAHLVAGADFDFQSSQQGGRLELGGIVVDFLFYYWKFCINVDGPGHDQTLRWRKDNEQDMALAEMGYRMFHLDTATIENEVKFEDTMRSILNLALSSGSGAGAAAQALSIMEEDRPLDENLLSDTVHGLNAIDTVLNEAIGMFTLQQPTT